jgi:hypothetical protein
LAYLSASAKAILESLGPQGGNIEHHKDNRGQADEVEESSGPGKGVVCPNLLFGWLIVATVFRFLRGGWWYNMVVAPPFETLALSGATAAAGVVEK